MNDRELRLLQILSELEERTSPLRERLDLVRKEVDALRRLVEQADLDEPWREVEAVATRLEHALGSVELASLLGLALELEVIARNEQLESAREHRPLRLVPPPDGEPGEDA